MTQQSATKDVIYSGFWQEEAETDNPLAAARCFYSGYDVYGDLLGKASWIEYLYLLFIGQRPTTQQTKLLEHLAVALANPGPRDHSVQAAMNGGAVVSTSAASLIAALAVGSGNLGGSHEVVMAMHHWHQHGEDLAAWQAALQNPATDVPIDIWLPMEHPAGFDPNGSSCANPVRQTLAVLSSASPGSALAWLQQHQQKLETNAGCPLAMTGVAAAAFVDLGLLDEDKKAPHQKAELLYLFLRLPGAAVHTVEQRQYGSDKFPFFADGVEMINSPKIKAP